MILFLLAAAATPSAEDAKFAECVALSERDPAAALTETTAWRETGGGILARQCEGLAYAAQERWLPAASAFEQAARKAEVDRDGRAARLWVQAGNAALAAGDASKAQGFFDSAIIGGQLNGEELGEAHLDRARAAVALGNGKAARAYIDTALKLVAADPLAWLLSATLARREGQLDRAQADIAEAAKRSPDDASVALEAGNIAILSGSEAAARTAWQAAILNAPTSDAGKAAAEALARLSKQP